jgi:hypothetical protein
MPRFRTSVTIDVAESAAQILGVLPCYSQEDARYDQDHRWPRRTLRGGRKSQQSVTLNELPSSATPAA